MFTTGDTLTYSYGGLGEEISDLQSLRAKRGQGLRLLHCFPISGHRLGLLYIISILIHGGQTSYELRLQPLNPTQHFVKHYFLVTKMGLGLVGFFNIMKT